MDDKTYSVNLDVSKVRGINISRYSDGYSYASISSKMGDDEFMSISYEWKGSQIPEFAMNVMEIMKSIGIEKASIEEDTVTYLERASKVLSDFAAKMKKKDKKEDMEDEEEEEDTNTFPFKKKKKAIKKEEVCETCKKSKEECKCKPEK